MHAKVEAGLFGEAVSKILTVIDKKNSRPILTYMFITAENNQLILSATDLEVSAKLIVEADIDKAGVFCVNAKNLFDILRELPNDIASLTINEDENSLKLSCRDIHYSLLVYRTDDFPQLTFSDQQSEFSLDSKDLSEIINKTSHAIATDETRLFLNGIFLQQIDSKLRVVATDGYRLSLIEKESDMPSMSSLIDGVIVPRKGVYELKKMCETFPEGSIKLSLSESFLYANVENKYYLSIRLISREYPKYQAVIPNNTLYTMTVDKTLFFDAVRRIKIMSNEKSNGVKVKFKENEVIITANHPSLGDAIEKVVAKFNGKEIETGFNARYLLDTISTFDDGDIFFELNNELSPFVVKSLKSPHHFGIVMPLKV